MAASCFSPPLWSRRQRGAGSAGRGDRRRCAGALRRGRGTAGAALRRDPLWRQILEMPAARERAYRGRLQRIGHPLRRDQNYARQRRMALRRAVLRARPGREPHQAAQEPAFLRSHQLPLAARQSGAPAAAHCRLLSCSRGAPTPPAYWLVRAARAPTPKPQPLARAEFTTLRLRLIKVAARVIETATRVRIAFAASHPAAELFAGIARWFQPAGP